MTHIVDMRVRLAAPLLVVLALASCGRGLPKGATSVYLTVQNGAALIAPDELFVSAYGDGVLIYDNDRLPEAGPLVPQGPGAVLGTVTLYVGAQISELRIVVSGHIDQVMRTRATTTVRISADRQVPARAVLESSLWDGGGVDGPSDGGDDGGTGDDGGVDGLSEAGADASDGDGGSSDAATGDVAIDLANDASGWGETGGQTDWGSADQPMESSPDAGPDAVPSDAAPPPDAGCQGSTLVGSSAFPTGTINLTAEGTLDWRFWGSGGAPFRRLTGNIISDYTLIGAGPIQTRFRNPLTFSWSNGSPTLSQTAANDTMVVAATVGGGASLTMATAVNPRVVSIYVGGANDTGRLEASLSDGCGQAYINTYMDRQDYNVVYRLTFKSAVPGTILNVKWTMTAGFEPIGLYAVTLN